MEIQTYILGLFLLFILSQDSLKIEASKKTKKFKPLVIETYFYVDYSVYKKWLDFKNGDKLKTIEEIEHFYVHSVKKVNEIYDGLRKNGIRISVVVSEFIINTEKTILGEKFLYYFDSLKDEWGKKNIYPKTQYDLSVFVITDDSEIYMGITSLKATCTKEPVIMMNHLSSTNFYHTLAHEIGHALGVDHDGSLTSKACDPKLNNLMKRDNDFVEEHLIPNAFKFSNCSVNAIKNYIKELDKKNKNCMRKTSGKIKKRKYTLPGLIYSLDQQCQLIYGPDSYYCRGGSVCKELSCYNPKDKVCLNEIRMTAADGTSCGNKMWCESDQCVYNSKATKLPGVLEHCHHGDLNDTSENKKFSCADIKNEPEKCYHYRINQKCCKTCSDLKKRDGCEYGDRKVEWCKQEVKPNPKLCKLKTIAHDCCSLCEEIYLNEDIGTVEVVETEECKDHLFFCRQFMPSECAINSFCCASCSAAKNL